MNAGHTTTQQGAPMRRAILTMFVLTFTTLAGCADLSTVRSFADLASQ